MPLIGVMQEMGAKLEAGTYPMKCTGIREDTIENSQFGDGRVYKWTLETTDMVGSDGLPVELEAMSSAKLTPMSKTTEWLAAFGIGFRAGPIDLEQVIGRHCLAMIEVEDKGDKGQFNRVKSLLSPPRSQIAHREALAPADEPEPLPAPTDTAADSGTQGPDSAAAPEQRAYIERLMSDLQMEGSTDARWDALRGEHEPLRTLPAWDALKVRDVAPAVNVLTAEKKRRVGVAG